MSTVDLPGDSGQSGPPFSLSDASHRSPPASIATGERIGSRADYRKLAAFALAQLCDSLGCPCAAIVARMASTPDLWRAVAKTIRGMATRDDRRHDQKACAEAAAWLAREESVAAAITLARVVGESLDDWHARVTAEMSSARFDRTVA